MVFGTIFVENKEMGSLVVVGAFGSLDVVSSGFVLVTDFFANAPAALGGGANSGLIALFSFDIAPGTAP